MGKEDSPSQKLGNSRTRWEYTVLYTGDDPSEDEEVLNKLGLDSWELVSVATSGRMYLKRLLPQQQPSDLLDVILSQLISPAKKELQANHEPKD